MDIESKIEGRKLGQARRWLNANGMLGFELSPAERARRVAEYARQVAETGHIVAWLPPARPKTPGYRSRFAWGDALRARRAS